MDAVSLKIVRPPSSRGGREVGREGGKGGGRKKAVASYGAVDPLLRKAREEEEEGEEEGEGGREGGEEGEGGKGRCRCIPLLSGLCRRRWSWRRKSRKTRRQKHVERGEGEAC